LMSIRRYVLTDDVETMEHYPGRENARLLICTKPAIQTPASMRVKALTDHALALEERALPRRRNSESNG